MTTEERILLHQKIDEMEYEVDTQLSEIYGDDWSRIENKQNFGKKVKKLVDAGELDNLNYQFTASNQHNYYKKSLLINHL